MKKICLIPARDGSKRLKNKNIKELGGKPLVAWTIECAINSNIFDEIILSTDSEVIASIGSSFGLPNVGLRPKHLSDDYSTASDVIKYYLENREDANFCYLQPTSPLRNTDDVKYSFELMEKNNAYSVISVNELHLPDNWVYRSEQSFELFMGNITTKRSQDYFPRYMLNGAVYWFNSLQFKKHNTHLIPEKCYPYIMPQNRSVDIDTESDFKLAEFYINSSVI